MKQLFSVVMLCILFGWSANLSAQAPNCFDSYLSPFCSGIAQYPANSDGTGFGGGPQAPVGPDYDCLGTQGNPNYFSITVGAGGNIDFTLNNSAGVDIDFILWGPFNGIAAAQNACAFMGTGGIFGTVIDCSFSGAAIEPVAIPNALPGEVYILMITNYANTPTNIFSTPSTGTGTISCPCDIPYTVDTMPTAFGNQGYLADTTNGTAQFVVCPNQTLGIQIEALAAINDTLSLYGPFSSVNSTFPNNTVFAFNPNAPAFYDSLTIFTLLTPDMSHIGVNSFNIGMKNDLYTGGLVDSSCFDILTVQVIVPGVELNDRNVCSGEVFQILVDSIPTTTVGSSNYTWTQLSGPAVNFSSTTVRQPTITIPSWSSTTVGDSVVIEVDYNYGTLCPMKDTMVLRFSNVSIAMNAVPDSVCVGQTTNLTAIISDTLTPPNCNAYTVTSIPHAPVAGTGTSVSLTDDALTGSLPIGFTFNFYCNNYTNFFISSNGFITFNGGNGNGCCSGELIPDPSPFGGPNDVIALAWSDLNPGAGGTINYSTVGVAPNRQLVVRFNNVPYFSGGGAVTGQIVLYEGSNNIDIHSINITATGTSTQGIENATGTVATPAPGRNASLWTATNSSYRFAQLYLGPFYAWTPAGTLSNATIGNPIASPNTATTYTVAITDGPCEYIDTVRVGILSSVAAPTAFCDSVGLTTISFSWSDIGLPGGGFYEYSVDSGATWINAGTSLSATATGLAGNTNYMILVRANDGSGSGCAVSPAASTTCMTLNPDCIGNPPINITLSSTSLLCNGDSTACVNAIVTGGSGSPMSLDWSNGAMDIDSICGLGAGTYTLVVTDTFTGAGGPGGNVVLYEQAFDGVHGWTLNVPTGVNGADNNFWTVSSDEAGNPVGVCGSAGGANRSLHVTSVFFPNGGAAYDAGGLCGFLFCPETNMRTESPNISTVGQSNITLKFNYIANGAGLLDNASVVYSINGGASWLVLNPSIKSPICPSTQGRWTAFSAALPATCNNIPNLKVGINWTNNDDGVGTDPSVAIDSVVVFTTTSGTSLVSCIETANITITQPTPLVITADSSNSPYCSNTNDGAIYTTASGGTPAYTYLWGGGQTTDDLTGLNTGVYPVTLTDGNGCMTTYQTTLTTPNAINIAVNSVTNNSCDSMPDGSISLTASGGTGTLSYAWSNGMTTNNLSNIPNGDYIITVTDQNNCSDTVQVTVTPTIVLTVTDSIVQPLCFGDSGLVVITVLGGSGTYSFDWGSAAATTTNTATTTGIFTVTITDSGNGCTTTHLVAIIGQNPLNIAQDSISNPGCGGSLDGYIYLTVTGGLSPYSYNWGGGQTTDDLTGLDAGAYSLTVTDANTCTATYQAILNVSPITILVTPINNQCLGVANGSILITTLGGTGSLTYLWNTGATTEDLTGIFNGTYTLVITDSLGCTDTAQATITPNTALTSSPFVTNNAFCFGQNGLAGFAVSNGTSPYTFNWGTSAAVTTNTAFIPAGTHYVTFTDGVGCMGTDSVIITQPTQLNLIATVNSIACNDTTNSGSIDITITGGTNAGYTYNWTGGATTEDLASLAVGIYTVVVTDSNGCTVTDTYTINQVAGITVNIDTIVGNLSCDLQPIGSIAANAVGGTGITYTWSNGATTDTLNSLPAGMYVVTASNSNGCTAIDTMTITQPIAPTVDAFVSVTGTSSITIPEGTAAVTISAGSTGFNYAWTATSAPATGNPSIANNSAATTTANPVTAGVYTYIVVASATTNGITCTATDTVWITVEAPYVGMPTAFTPNNDGDNDNFRPVMLSDEDVKTFIVYNRWGQVVYNGDATHGLGWDGTYLGAEQASDVYLYLIIFQKASDPEPTTIRGEVTLIR